MRGGSPTIDRPLPPDLRPTDPGGGGGGWSWLLTARGIIEAQLVRGLLEGAGVAPIHLATHDPSPSSWMFLSGDVNAPVRVFVLRSQLDAARLALLEGGLGLPDEEAAPEEPAVGRSLWWRVLGIAAGIVILAGFLWRLFIADCQFRALC